MVYAYVMNKTEPWGTWQNMYVFEVTDEVTDYVGEGRSLNGCELPTPAGAESTRCNSYEKHAWFKITH